MSTEKKRAILAVSFGTSYADTCERTIEAIENEIREAYPQCAVYRAWTSGKIRRKIEKRDGVHIFSVSEALEQMKKDGVTELVVQPTHVLNGIENDLMFRDIHVAGNSFEKVAVSTPLLTTQRDIDEVVDLLAREWKIGDDEMLVFMGHGTDHFSNTVYAAINYQFMTRGHENMVMGTVEGYPEVGDVVAAVKKSGARKVVLTPFMIVAGDHANNDLAGDEEDSWKSIFEKEGYEVRCVLKGLGEYEGIRKIFMKHLADTMESM